jgi:hypothetical protein
MQRRPPRPGFRRRLQCRLFSRHPRTTKSVRRITVRRAMWRGRQRSLRHARGTSSLSALIPAPIVAPAPAPAPAPLPCSARPGTAGAACPPPPPDTMRTPVPGMGGLPTEPGADPSGSPTPDAAKRQHSMGVKHAAQARQATAWLKKTCASDSVQHSRALETVATSATARMCSHAPQAKSHK